MFSRQRLSLNKRKKQERMLHLTHELERNDAYHILLNFCQKHRFLLVQMERTNGIKINATASERQRAVSLFPPNPYLSSLTKNEGIDNVPVNAPVS